MANKYLNHIKQTEKKYDLKPGFLEHLIRVESGGYIDNVSSKGAYGLTQLMPETAKRYGVDPKDPFQNIEGGAHYFRDLLNMFNGSYSQALAAYNAGELKESVKNRNWDKLPEETKNYVSQFENFLDYKEKKLEEKPEYRFKPFINEVIKMAEGTDTWKNLKKQGASNEDIINGILGTVGLVAGGKVALGLAKLPVRLGKTVWGIGKGLYKIGKSEKEFHDYTPREGKTSYQLGKQFLKKGKETVREGENVIKSAKSVSRSKELGNLYKNIGKTQRQSKEFTQKVKDFINETLKISD